MLIATKNRTGVSSANWLSFIFSAVLQEASADSSGDQQWDMKCRQARFAPFGFVIAAVKIAGERTQFRLRSPSNHRLVPTADGKADICTILQTFPSAVVRAT